MATTANRGYPYPTASDNVRPYEHIQDLAEALDTELDALLGPGTTYVPVFQADGGSPSVGSTGAIVGRYSEYGEGLILARGRMVFGGTGISGGSGSWYVTLPVAARADTSPDIRTIGNIYMRDSSPGQNYFGFALIDPNLNAGRISMFSSASPAVQVNSTAPFAWAAGDHLSWTVLYEPA